MHLYSKTGDFIITQTENSQSKKYVQRKMKLSVRNLPYCMVNL